MRPLIAVWLCCLARLVFYAAALPVWEGYDEWAHFAVIRATALQGQIIASKSAPIQRDVRASLELAPVPWALNYLPAPAVTQDAFWALPADKRAEREARFRAMPIEWNREVSTGNLTQYEAQQPPLYYWMMAPAMWMAQSWSLSAQLMLVRLLSVLIASLAIPLVYLIALEVLSNATLALGAAAMLAAMPGFAMDVARAGNECAGVVLFSLLIWLGLRGKAWLSGVVLGLGLLTKAYFLTAFLFFGWQAMVAAGVTGGWWYLYNGLTAGLNDSAAAGSLPVSELWHRVAAIPWFQAADTILFSHLYFGGWSGLQVRSWMYHVFYAVILLAAIGLLREWKTRERKMLWLASIYAAFWAGLFYFAAVLYVAHEGGGSPGWYMYAVVAAEIVLCIAGLRRILPHRWIAPMGVALFAALDLYAMHAMAIPYYTGMIRHRTGGGMTALHFRDVGFHEAFTRLAMFKPPVFSGDILIALWVVYLAATCWLVGGTMKEMDLRK